VSGRLDQAGERRIERGMNRSLTLRWSELRDWGRILCYAQVNWLRVRRIGERVRSVEGLLFGRWLGREFGARLVVSRLDRRGVRLVLVREDWEACGSQHFG
jgi:hypothetical protein